MSEETNFSILRKNLRRTFQQVRQNLGLKGKPILQYPILRPRRVEPIEYEEEPTRSEPTQRSQRQPISILKSIRRIFEESARQVELQTRKLEQNLESERVKELEQRLREAQEELKRLRGAHY